MIPNAKTVLLEKSRCNWQSRDGVLMDELREQLTKAFVHTTCSWLHEQILRLQKIKLEIMLEVGIG